MPITTDLTTARTMPGMPFILSAPLQVRVGEVAEFQYELDYQPQSAVSVVRFLSQQTPGADSSPNDLLVDGVRVWPVTGLSNPKVVTWQLDGAASRAGNRYQVTFLMATGTAGTSARKEVALEFTVEVHGVMAGT